MALRSRFPTFVMLPTLVMATGQDAAGVCPPGAEVTHLLPDVQFNSVAKMLTYRSPTTKQEKLPGGQLAVGGAAVRLATLCQGILPGLSMWWGDLRRQCWEVGSRVPRGRGCLVCVAPRRHLCLSSKRPPLCAAACCMPHAGPAGVALPRPCTEGLPAPPSTVDIRRAGRAVGS